MKRKSESSQTHSTDNDKRRVVPHLVVTDLDGTLWDPSIKCHPATLKALAQLVQREIPVLVATGRRANSAQLGLSQNGLSLPTVLLNGALGIDFPIKHQFHIQPFTDAQTKTAIDIFEQLDVSPSVYLADGRVAVGKNTTTSPAHRGLLGDDVTALEPAEATGQSDALSFIFLSQRHDALAPLVSAVEASTVQAKSSSGPPTRCADYSFYQDPLFGGWSLHMHPPGISKREGIEAYLEYANLAPDQIVALGDGTNDLEMLEMADLALSMEDASPEAKALADVIIPPPKQGGWARVIDHLG